MWLKMVSRLEKVDKKYDAHLKTVWILIFMSCDEDVQEILTQEETNGNMKLNGENEDASRKILIEKTIDLIEQDSPI